MTDFGDRMQKNGARWCECPEVVNWWMGALHPFGTDVGSLIPDTFDAYCRVLHPPKASDGSSVRWGDLTESRVDGEVRLDTLLASRTTKEHLTPRQGSLPLDQLSVVVEHLSTVESSDVLFGMWTGYGWLQGSPAVAPLGRGDARQSSQDLSKHPSVGVRLSLPHRDYTLYKGPVGAAATFMFDVEQQSPNLWWDKFHSWVVATEVDKDSTYIGGRSQLIHGLMQDARLEVVAVEPWSRLA